MGGPQAPTTCPTSRLIRFPDGDRLCAALSHILASSGEALCSLAVLKTKTLKFSCCSVWAG